MFEPAGEGEEGDEERQGDGGGKEGGLGRVLEETAKRAARHPVARLAHVAAVEGEGQGEGACKRAKRQDVERVGGPRRGREHAGGGVGKGAREAACKEREGEGDRDGGAPDKPEDKGAALVGARARPQAGGEFVGEGRRAGGKARPALGNRARGTEGRGSAGG